MGFGQSAYDVTRFLVISTLSPFVYIPDRHLFAKIGKKFSIWIKKMK